MRNFYYLVPVFLVSLFTACDNPVLGGDPAYIAENTMDARFAEIRQELSCSEAAHDIQLSLDGESILGACLKNVEGFQSPRLALFRCPLDGRECQEELPDLEDTNHPEHQFEFTEFGTEIYTRKTFIELRQSTIAHLVLSSAEAPNNVQSNGIEFKSGGIGFYDFDRRATGTVGHFEATNFEALAANGQFYYDHLGNLAGNPSHIQPVALAHESNLNRFYVLANQYNENVKLPSLIFTFEIDDKGGLLLLDTRINALSYNAANMIVASNQKIYILNDSQDEATFLRNANGRVLVDEEGRPRIGPKIQFYSIDLDGSEEIAGIPGSSNRYAIPEIPGDRLLWSKKSNLKQLSNGLIVFDSYAHVVNGPRIDSVLQFFNPQTESFIGNGYSALEGPELTFLSFEEHDGQYYFLGLRGYISRMAELVNGLPQRSSEQLGLIIAENNDPIFGVARANTACLPFEAETVTASIDFDRCSFRAYQTMVTPDGRLFVSVKNEINDRVNMNFNGLAEFQVSGPLGISNGPSYFYFYDF